MYTILGGTVFGILEAGGGVDIWKRNLYI